MPISLKSIAGGGALPIGGRMMASRQATAPLLVSDGQTFLRSGHLLLDEQATYPEAYAALTLSDADTWLATDFLAMPDTAVTWNPIKLASNGQRLVAITGNDKNIYVSDDGTNWSLAFTATQTQTTLTYAQGYFFTSGTNRLVRSADGLTWTEIAISPSAFAKIIEGPTAGELLAMGSGADYVYKSTNYGGTWSGASGGSLARNDLQYANGLYLAPHSTGLYTSPDGITWASRSVSASSAVYAIGFGNGKFLASIGTTLYESTDAITWAAVTTQPLSIGTIYLLAYIAGAWLAVGTGGHATSVDGSNWTRRSTTAFGVTVQTAPQLFLQGALLFLTTANGMWRSRDNGLTWDAQDPRSPAAGNIVSLPGRLVVGVADMNKRMVSAHISFVGTLGMPDTFEEADSVAYLRIK